MQSSLDSVYCELLNDHDLWSNTWDQGRVQSLTLKYIEDMFKNNLFKNSVYNTTIRDIF